MKRYITIIFSFILVQICFAEKAVNICDQSSFDKAKNINVDYSFNEIIDYISSNTKEDNEKLSMLCGWFYFNFDYDIEMFKSGEVNSDWETSFSTKKGICYDICNLFQKFCSELEVRCETIEGYTKGFDKQFNFCETNHTWNIVKIDDDWFHCDVLWTIGELVGNSLQDSLYFQKRDNYLFFLSRNDGIFMSEHIPAMPIWQLKNIVIPLEYQNASEHIDEAIIVDYKKELDNFYKLDDISRSLFLADKAHEFNPENFNIKTVNYFNAGVEYYNIGNKSNDKGMIQKAEQLFLVAKENVGKSCNGVTVLEDRINEGLKKIRNYSANADL